MSSHSPALWQAWLAWLAWLAWGRPRAHHGRPHPVAPVPPVAPAPPVVPAPDVGPPPPPAASPESVAAVLAARREEVDWRLRWWEDQRAAEREVLAGGAGQHRPDGPEGAA